MQLRSLIFITIFTIGVFPLLALVSVNLKGHIARHEAVSRSQVATRAQLTFSKLNMNIRHLGSSLKGAVTLPLVQDYFLFPTFSVGQQEALVGILSNLFESIPEIKRLYLVDKEGNVFEDVLQWSAERTRQIVKPSTLKSDFTKLVDTEVMPETPLTILLSKPEEFLTAQDYLEVNLAIPVRNSTEIIIGYVVVALNNHVLFSDYLDSSWISPIGESFSLKPNFQVDGNSQIIQEMLNTNTQPFIAGINGKLISWTPFSAGQDRLISFWLASTIDMSGPLQWKKSLVMNIVIILMITMIMVLFVANTIARRVDKIQKTLLTGLDKVINKDQEVHFSWKGPREIVTLAEDLTILTRKYVASRSIIRQADKMRSLGLLVSGVAHEINNPNSIAMLNVPLLSKSWDNALPLLDKYYQENGEFSLAGIEYSEMRGQIPRLLSELDDSNKRISNIVKDLKNYARQDTRQIFVKVNVNQLIQTAMRLTQNQLKKSTDNLQLNLADDIPEIDGIKQKIEQVLINLIQNACDSLQNSNEQIAITSSYDSIDETVSIRIDDEGVGIEEDKIIFITDPFYTTKRSQGGTGLGLSVSAGIVREHHGRLEFSSQIGQGTSATIILPEHRNPGNE